MTPYYTDPLVTLHLGDCLDVMPTLEAESVDAVVTDPPYGLGFMGKHWDHGVPAREFWAEMYRVAKPGAYLLAFGGTRTIHRIMTNIEDAGWEIRDMLTWIYACLSDDTEILTNEGWVRYNRASEASHAAAFDPATGKLQWERIAGVHKYDHDGPMVEVGPSLVTLNHRVVLSSESQVPLPSSEDLRRLSERVPDVESLSSDEGEDVLPRVLAETALHAAYANEAGGPEGSVVLLPGVREADMEARRLGQAHHRADVFEGVQREAAHPRSALPSGQGVDRGTQGEGGGSDARPPQSRLEGRSYRVQEARELLWSALRSGSRVGVADGTQGRLHHGAPPSTVGTVRLLAESDGSGEPREPQSNRQPPRESDSVAGQPDAQAVRVRQGDSGDHLSAPDVPRLVDYAGVVWCITVPSGAFLARRGGVAFVTGNSGFPKSLDVSKALDKVNGETDRAHKFTAWMRTTGMKSGQLDRITSSFMGSHYLTDKAQAAVPTRVMFELIRTHLTVEVPAWIDTLIDREEAERQKVGERRDVATRMYDNGEGPRMPNVIDVTAPATDLARKWEGWGTALKPAHEPIVMARKPLVGTVAANVTRYGVGALNIEGARIGNGDGPGRWPSNVLLDSEHPELFDEPNPAVIGSGSATEEGVGYSRFFIIPKADRAERERGLTGAPKKRRANDEDIEEFVHPAPEGIGAWLKAQRERVGLTRRQVAEHFPSRTGGITGCVTNWEEELNRPTPEQWWKLKDILSFDDGRYDETMTVTRRVSLEERTARSSSENVELMRRVAGLNAPRANHHPTVKPIDLMRHLVRLVTPPGGVVLDPFLGSGSTALAASEEGFRCIGIEREPEYLEIAVGRLMATPMGLGLNAELVGKPVKQSAGKMSGYNWEESVNDNPTHVTRNIKSGVHYGDGPRRPPKPPKPVAPTNPMWDGEEPAA